MMEATSDKDIGFVGGTRGGFTFPDFLFSIDGMYDRRSGAWFVISPLGGRNDGEIANEKAQGNDWNPV